MRVLVIGIWTLTLLVTGVPLLADDVSSADVVFVKRVAEASIGKTEAGRLALARAGSPAVRHFAERLLEDHQKMQKEVGELAHRKSIVLPTEPGPAHRSALAKLSRLHGTQFDAEFSKAFGVNAHQDALVMFAQAGQAASDPDIRTFATKSVAQLQASLALAEQLSN